MSEDAGTALIYMDNIESNYVREFEARVVKRGFDYVLLDRTAFYPLGGGQPSDTGRLAWPGGGAKVREVTKREGIKHHLELDPEMVPDDVLGILDWDKRYAHMRMHTAQHIVSGVVYDLWKARTVGNQLYHDRSRIDFAPIKFTDDMISQLEDVANAVLAKGTPVEIKTMSRADLEGQVDSLRANLDLLPKSVQELRVVVIGEFDVCPCAGTHVRSLSEVGKVKVTKRENKGKERERVTYELL